MFYDAKGKEMLSQGAHDFVTGVLYHAKDLCLLMNPSVNSYRRLDPAYEAPNEIKVSSVDRGSMIRIPLGNEKSARIEVRTVAPDVNPYLCFFAILKAGIKGMTASIAELEKMKREVYEKDVEKLPGDIYAALADYNASTFLKDEMGADNHRKYAELKSESADRSPRALGSSVKAGEVLYHHEVTNQLIWDKF